MIAFNFQDFSINFLLPQCKYIIYLIYTVIYYKLPLECIKLYLCILLTENNVLYYDYTYVVLLLKRQIQNLRNSEKGCRSGYPIIIIALFFLIIFFLNFFYLETAGFRLGDTPSDSFLSALPKKLGYCVLTLGIELGLRITDIEAVFVRYPRDLFSQVYEVLKIWKQKTPENTYLNLMLAIRRVRGKQFLERNFGCDN